MAVEQQVGGVVVEGAFVAGVVATGGQDDLLKEGHRAEGRRHGQTGKPLIRTALADPRSRHRHEAEQHNHWCLDIEVAELGAIGLNGDGGEQEGEPTKGPQGTVNGAASEQGLGVKRGGVAVFHKGSMVSRAHGRG